MRYTEFNERIIDEGGNSNAVRYNSELAALVAFTGGNSLDNIPKNALKDPKLVMAEIDKVRDTYDEKIFTMWYHKSLEYKEKILNHFGKLPKKYDWVAGENAGEVADLVFVDFPISGISIKDSGGITLANLTPKALGLNPLKGTDVLQHYAPKQFINFKKNVVSQVLIIANSSPDEEIIPKNKYSIKYNSETTDYTIKLKAKGGLVDKKFTESEIKGGLQKNALWQRVFGDWFQENFQEYKNLIKPLVIEVSTQFEEIMADTLGNNDKLKRILQFEDRPYYYATPKKIYYVPSAADAGDLKLKGVSYAAPDGTSQLWKAKIGNDETDDGTIIDIYIRFANGLFATNSTARVQSLKNPQFIAWDEL